VSQAVSSQAPSDFRAVLRRLVEETPGAWGAIFVDWEGEAVDLFATSDEYEVKLAGAETGLLLNRLVAAGTSSELGRTIAMQIRAADDQYFLHTLDQEYFVLLGAIARARLAAAVEELRRLV